MIEINTNPSRQILRQFGFIALVGFGAIGGLVIWRNGLFGIDFGSGARPAAFVLWGLGFLSALCSVAAPAANRPLYVSLCVVTYPIGLVVSFLIMGFVFYGILTPIGLCFRIVGRDALERRFDPGAETYWVPMKPVRDLRRYYRQF